MPRDSHRCVLLAGVMAATGCNNGGEGAGEAGGTEGSTETGTGADIELPPRPEQRFCRFDGNPPGLLPQLELQPAFGSLRFTDPVAIAAAPGRPETLWIAERAGRVLAFDATLAEPEASVVVDLSLDAATTLEAIAFSPDFAADRHLFVRTHREGSPGLTSVMRLALGPDDAPLVDETMTVLQVSYGPDARRGGAMLFDATGMLVVALGDGGLEGELPEEAQDPGTRYGSILRLDVAPLDATGTYGIPSDNPLADDPDPVAAQAWAWGARHPTHCSVDRTEGTLWCGDVGELEQEVGRVPAGGNLGWPILEGTRCRAPTAQCEGLDAESPRSSYDDHAGDCEVVGGLVYRGESFPELGGAYLYADRCSGRVRALRLRPDGTIEHDELLAQIDGEPVAFGEDAYGELYLADGANGRLWRVTVPASDAPFPVRLSDSGCFDDLGALVPAPDLVPYEVNAPLWTDGALKHRHITLSPGETIAIEPDGALSFPIGTYLLKTFVLERVAGDPSSRTPVETRVMIRREHGWEFHSYQWDEQGTDAMLLAEGRQSTFWMQDGDESYELPYFYPDRFECRTCHGSAPSNVLGPRIDQLDRRVELTHGGYDQLAQMEAIGLFEGVLPLMDPIVNPKDEDAPIEERARAYLHANCGHCHRPGGWTPPELDMDLRWSRTLEQTRTCDVPPQYHNPWADASRRIAPGDPDDSLLWRRIRLRGLGQMPPLGTSLVDPTSEVVGAWIEQLVSCE